MPKILYVCDGISPWVVGGMQSVSRRHIGWLRELGFEVVAVTSRKQPTGDTSFASKIEYVAWPERSPLHKFDLKKYAKQLISFSERVTGLIDFHSPNLIYSEGPLLSAYLDRSQEMRVPVIFHPHGLEMYQRTGSTINDFRLRPLRPLVRKHAHKAQVTLSQGGRLDGILLNDVGIRNDRIKRLPNCTPANFAFAEQPRTNNKGRFLFVGRDEVRKGLGALIRAVADVDGAQLDIVGGSKRLDRLPGQYVIHGEIANRNRLRAIYDEVDFLVVPSLAEGMPTVILEALSAGLPVIATDVGAVAAVIKDGQNGFLIPRADYAALREALIKAKELRKPDYTKFSSNALDMAKNVFSPMSVRMRLDSIVRRLLLKEDKG